MDIYLDTAKVEEIREALELGVLDGVTTNPTLIARAGRDYREAVEEICALVHPRPVSVEVLETEADAIVQQAREFAEWADNVVIKVATTKDGLRAMARLRDIGIPVNATLIFSVNQGILAIKAGAAYVSPFMGRLDDIGHSGLEVTARLVEFLDVYEAEYDCRVIAASVRHPQHVVACAQVGAHIVTMPHKVLMQMLKHPLTDIGLERFLRDWREAQKQIVQK